MGEGVISRADPWAALKRTGEPTSAALRNKAPGPRSTRPLDEQSQSLFY